MNCVIGLIHKVMGFMFKVIVLMHYSNCPHVSDKGSNALDD